MTILERPLLLLGIAVSAIAVAAGVTFLSGWSDRDCVEIEGARQCVELFAEEDRRPVPEEAVEVLGGDGAEMSLAELRGQVVVVNFWASWCGPCRAEQPELNEAHERLAGTRDDVAFVGVAVQDAEVNAIAHEREFAIPYPSLNDPSTSYTSRFRGIGPRALPTTIVLDREGRVAVRLFGTTTLRELEAIVPVITGDAPLEG